MGLIYSSGDSENLISTTQVNLAATREVVAQLKAATNHLVSTIGTFGMQGEAYEAGRDLFENEVSAAIQKVDAVADYLERDLSVYISADSQVSHWGYLDEDRLERLIETTKNKIQRMHDIIHELSRMGLGHSSGLIHLLRQQIHNEEAHLRKYREMLNDLREFSSSTAGLFNNVGSELGGLLHGISVGTLGSSSASKSVLTHRKHAHVSKKHASSILGDKKKHKRASDHGLGGFLVGGSGLAKSILEAGRDESINKINEWSKLAMDADKAGKWVTRSLAASLTPRSSSGSFMKDTNQVRRYVTHSLRSASKDTSSWLSNMAPVAYHSSKLAGTAFTALGFTEEYKEFQQAHGTKHVGRAVTQAGISAGSGIGAGLAASAGIAAAVGSAPLWVTVGIVGLATWGVSEGASWLYDNQKMYRQGVNLIGDNGEKTIKSLGNNFGNPKYYNSTTYPVGPKY